jgi:hypothetical protein
MTTIEKPIEITSDTFPQLPDFIMTAIVEVLHRDVTIHTTETDRRIEETIDQLFATYRPMLRRYIGAEIFGMEADSEIVKELRLRAIEQEKREIEQVLEQQGEEAMEEERLPR